MSEKYHLRYFSNRTMIALLTNSDSESFVSKAPFDTFTKDNGYHNKVNEMPFITKLLPKADIQKEILGRMFFETLEEMNDIFVKINNGSIDVRDDDHFKELMLEKVKNNLFLLDGEGRVSLIQWLNIAFLFIDYEPDELSEICEVIEESGRGAKFVSKLYHNVVFKDKAELANNLIDIYLPVFESSGQWFALKKATFVMHFLAKQYAKDRVSEAAEAYNNSIEEFEKATGRDANWKPYQRHTDRFSKNQYYRDKQRKMADKK